MRYSSAKIVLSLLLVVWYFTMPMYGFGGESDVLNGCWGHILYPLSHANVWHLLANILCLWMIPCRLHVLFSYTLAVVCSLFPCFIDEPTMGFSGVLFSMVGISWGKIHQFKEMIWRNKWFLFLPLFIPHVNAFIHLYCIIAGYCVGCCLSKKKLKTGDWV